MVGTLPQSAEGRPVGESNGFGFSPPLRPGLGVVSPPGVQNLSMKGSRNGMVATVVEERGEKGQERMEQGSYQSTPQVLFSDVYIEIYSTRDARLSLPLRIPAIPRPTRSPRRIDCPVVRTPNLSVCAE